MKSIISIILVCLVAITTLCACGGNYAPISLDQPIPLPEDGVIGKDVLDRIKLENAIATFTGNSGGFDFEWKIFGSKLEDTRDVNLSLTIEKIDGEIELQFAEGEAFGFSAFLSITLDEKWSALDATAYSDGKAVASVSLTGSKTTILNLSVSEPWSSVTIRPNVEENSTTAVEVETNIEATETQTETETETQTENETETQIETETSNRPVSDGDGTDQDKYKTDPVPEGKPLPVEPENQEVNKGKAYTCTFSIECATILNNLGDLDSDKLELIPLDGIILAPTTVTFYEGESVFDVIQRVCKEYNIHLEFSWTPVYNSAYIEGIHNLYEFDCGAISGWMYRVDGWYPNYGCSRYQLADGEVVEWRYTCDLGHDVGCDWMQ